MPAVDKIDPGTSIFSAAGLNAITPFLQSLFGPGTTATGQNGTSSQQTAGASSSNSAQTGATTQNGTTTSSGSSTSDLAIEPIKQLLASLFAKGAASGGQYSRENAILDAQGGVQQILKTLKDTSLPGVRGAEAGTGAYNSTVKTMLSNDLSARAAGQGAALVSDNVARYAGLENNQTAQLLSALGIAANAQRTTTGTTNTTGGSTTTGNTTTEGVNSGTVNATTTGSGTTNNKGLVGNSGAQTAAALGIGGVAALQLVKSLFPSGLSLSSVLPSGSTVTDLTNGTLPDDYSWLTEALSGSGQDLSGITGDFDLTTLFG